MKKSTRLVMTLFMICFVKSISYAQTPSPNVVIIIADDMGWSQTSSVDTSMNNPSDFYETPNIDLLANEGIAFPNSYVNGANCAPTRAAILSGQWASRPTNNVFAVNGLNRGDANSLLVGPSQGLSNGEDEIPASAITIAETVKTSPEGYTTAHFGKYHSGGSLSNGPTDQGFDFNYGGDSDGAPGSYFAALNGTDWEFHARIGPELDVYADPYTAQESLDLAGDNSIEGTNKHVTDALGDAALDFMETNKSTPFFMHFSNYAIHGPWGQANARPDLYSKYVAKNSTNPSQIGHDNVAQAAILEGMDQNIGRIIDYLKTTADPRNPGNMLSANTLVYFISDNGGANGPEDNVPLKGMKGEYTEGGIRSVTFAWSEGLLANMGTINNTPIQAFDLYPTLAEITGASLPSGYDIDGVSQWSMLTGVNPDLGRDALYWHFPGYIANSQRDQRPVSIIRKGDYKLIHYYETASYELYNLDTDIGEATDLLAGSPDTATLTIANDMSTDLLAYLINVSAPLPTYRSTGATVPLPEVIEITTPPVDGSCVAPETYQALWSFDTTSGTDDVSSNGNDAIAVIGTITYDAVDFKEGDQAAVFDGATKIQYSQNPGPFMITATSARTITMWVKPSSFSGIQDLFEEGGGSRGFVIRLNGTNVETIVRSSNSASDSLSAAFPNDGDWHHIALVYNGSLSSHQLYIDGVLTSSSGAAAASIANHTGAGGLGGVQTRDSFGVTADSFYTGKMDAVAVYNAALSGSQVLSAACLEDNTTPCTYTVINTEGFETDWGIWNDGGVDADRNIADAAYANTGSYCIELQDNTDESVMTTNTLDLSPYEELTVDFSYICVSMDNVNEDFWVQISTDAGASFVTVAEWNLNDEFVNNQRNPGQALIAGPFTTTTQLRFRADASGNQDWVYIDDVVISGCQSAAARIASGVEENQVISENIAITEEGTVQSKFSASVYPSMFTEEIFISLKGINAKQIEVQMFNSIGQRVYIKSFNAEEKIRIASPSIPAGQYFMQIHSGNDVVIKQLIKM
ncbi:sulfatase-like hydrolase/transferase [Aquimarina pacifica]|uniref:sulfatase-like hydrolase/transferase n=1 Tax=Aquimarina pacifica TaxID=1296415 RepID=UPI0004B7DE9E|nr:sulfatase-like hydrolase/transferase [Aquimarina pacifica]